MTKSRSLTAERAKSPAIASRQLRLEILQMIDDLLDGKPDSERLVIQFNRAIPLDQAILFKESVDPRQFKREGTRLKRTMMAGARRGALDIFEWFELRDGSPSRRISYFKEIEYLSPSDARIVIRAIRQLT